MFVCPGIFFMLYDAKASGSKIWKLMALRVEKEAAGYEIFGSYHIFSGTQVECIALCADYGYK